MSIIAFGYQGLGNIGDDLMHLCVLEGKNRVYVRRGRRLRATDIELPLYLYLIKLVVAKRLIYTGGNIFTYETKRSAIKLLLFMAVGSFRKLCGKKTEFHSVGINQKVPGILKPIIVKSLRSATYIHVRDKTTHTMLDRHGVPSKLSPDVVLTSSLPILMQRTRASDVAPYVVYFPSSPGIREGNRLQRNNAKRIFDATSQRKIISIVQSPDDVAIVQGRYPESRIFTYDFAKLHEILDVIYSAAEIHTERYHGAILARRFGIKYQSSDNTEKLKNIYFS